MSAKVKLSDDDWKALIPGREFKVAGTTLTLRPLDIQDLTSVIRMSQRITDVIKEYKITADNYGNPKSIAVIADMVISVLPDVVSNCSGLEIDDVKRLPIALAISMVTALIEINLESKEDLEKNLEALTATIKTLGPIGA